VTHFRVLCITDDGTRAGLDAVMSPFDAELLVEPYVTESGELTRYNPLGEWDYWVPGGRWANDLLLMDGARVSAARRCDVDVERMRRDAYDNAIAHWNRMDEACSHLPRALTLRELEQVNPDLDAAGLALRGQLRWAALQGWGNLEEYQNFTGEQYGRYRADWAVPGLATCSAEGWMSAAPSYWLGSDPYDSVAREYLATVNRLVDQLPDHQWLTIVDCHQ